MHYAIDCPYSVEERGGVCEMSQECRCTPVEEPPWPEPTYAPYKPNLPGGSLLDGMGRTGYAYGSDIIAVAMWSAYWQRHEEHEEIHPNGYEPTGHCWAQSDDHCWPEPLAGWPGSPGVPNEPGVYRVSVDNDGHYEDSVLVLELWEEGDGKGPEDAAQERLVTA
jgi:hypothetical protein